MIITGIAFYLRWLFLINDSLTSYEFYFIDMAKADASHLMQQVTHFTHQPVFVYILYFWNSVFHLSEFSAKFLPLLFGVILVIAIPVIAFFEHDLFDKNSALLAACIVALSPIHIFFSSQVSPYSLFVLLSFLSNVFFFLFLKKTKFRYSMFYFFSILLTIYTHISGLVILFIHVLFICHVKQNIKKLLCIYGMLLIFYLPWCIRILPGQISMYLSAPGLINAVKYDPPLPTPQTILTTFLDYSADSYPLLFLFLFLTWYGLLKEEKNINSSLFLLAWMAAPPLIFYLISIFIISVYKFKALFFISLPLYILAAKGIVRFNTAIRTGFVIIITSVMCIKLFGTPFYQPEENWKGLLSTVEEQCQSGIVIAYPPPIKSVVAYYFKRNFYVVNNVEDLKRVLSTKAATGRIFLVMRWEGDGNKAILGYLKDNYNLVSERDYKPFYRYGQGAFLSSYVFI